MKRKLLAGTIAIACNFIAMDLRAASLHDDFSGSSLNTSMWRITNGSSGVKVGGGLLELSGSPDYKRINSIETFNPGTNGVMATSRIELDGDYQKFGFGINISESLGIYFSTVEPNYGGGPNYIHALIHDRSTNTFLHDSKVAVTWGTFHDLGVEWSSNSARFLIDGTVVSEYISPVISSSLLSVGIANDRTSLMQADFVNVSSVPLPATMLLFGTGIVGMFGTRIRKRRSIYD